MSARPDAGEVAGFSDLEAVKAAVAMEREGLAFYRDAAAAAGNPELSGVFRQMAGEEQKHLARFEDMAGALAAARAEEYWDDPDVSEYIRAVISPRAMLKPSEAPAAAAGMKVAADALHFALAAEKQTVLFYSTCADSARRAEVRKVFHELVAEERRHVALVGRWLRQAGG